MTNAFRQLTLLAFTQFLGGMTFSLLSAFYQKEAEAKGLSISQSGWVFGSVFLTTILATPVFSRYMETFGCRFFFVYGTLLSAISNILFGALQWIDDAQVFFALSLILRIVTALGESAFFSAIYPLTSRESSNDRRSCVLSLMEALNGVGLMMGPVVGGLLYQSGGFACPFFTCGGMLLVCGLVSALLILPSPAAEPPLEDGKNARSRFRNLVQIPSVLVSCILLIVSEMSVTWYLPTLQALLTDKFGLPPVAVGGLFMVEGATYALFSPLWGLYLDKRRDFYSPLAIGLLAVIVAFTLLATARSITLIFIGLFLQGGGVAATFITTLMFMNEETVSKRGWSDTDQTRAMITSLWFISENVAGLLGTTFGGLTYDMIGFPLSCLVVIGCQLVGLILLGCLFYRRGKKEEDESPLLPPHSNKEDKNANYQSIH